MKKTAIVAALAASLMATAAQAGSIRVEGESQLNGTDREALKIEAWQGLTGPIGAGLEVKTFVADGSNPAFTNISGKLGYALPTVAGFSPVVVVEAGVRTGAGNAEFWGVGGEVQRPLTQNLRAVVGYRYRDGFNQQFATRHRAHAGVDYDINKSFAVGATYYNYRQDGQNTDAVAVSVTRKF